MYNLDLRPALWFIFFLGLSIWGIWELVDWLFIDEVIRSKTPIVPEIKLIVRNNIIDTIYVYRSR